MPLTSRRREAECRASLVRDAAEALDEAGLRLCVLHGSDSYPNVESDLDAVCTDRRRIPAILAARARSVLVQAIEHERDAWYYILHGACAGGPVFVALDVSADYRRNGRVFYSGSQLARACRPQREIDRPSPDVEFACYLIKKLLKADLQPDHATELSRIYAGDPSGCEREVRRFFADSDVRLLVRAASQGDWSEVQARVTELRRGLLFRVGVRAPLGMLRYWWEDAIRRLRRMIRPTGVLVLVTGGDPSHTAAIMGGVESFLAPAFRRTARRTLTRGRGVGAVRERAAMYVQLYSSLVRSTLVLLESARDAGVPDRPAPERGPLAGWERVLRRVPPSWGLKVYVASEASQHPPAAQGRSRSGWHVVDGSRPMEQIIAEVAHVVVQHMVQRTAHRLHVGAHD